MRALDDVVVVAVEQAVAAPLCTRHLADLGARVIKVEQPDGGDLARSLDSAVNGLASHFVWLNRSKESVAVDLKTSHGRDIMESLLRRADIFVQNLAPGALSRLGLTPERMAELNEHLIQVNMSGYGPGGPYSERRAYDMLVQAEAGLVSITGTPDQPAKTGIPAVDIAAAMYAFSGALAALYRRQRGGGGTCLEISMLEAIAEWMGHPLYYTMYTGQQPPRSGVGHPVISPYDRYPTRDGVGVLIGVQSEVGWRRLAEVLLGQPELAEQEGMRTNRERTANRAQVDAIVGEATAKRTASEVVDICNEAGIPVARFNGVDGLINHPQLAARERWHSTPSPVGPIRTLLPPITFADEEARMGSIPDLGADTESVLRELGYSTPDIDELRGKHVIG